MPQRRLLHRFSTPTRARTRIRRLLPLFGADFGFGLDGDFDQLFLLGENASPIDAVSLISQPADQSTARAPDGGAGWVTLAIPTPGLSNQTSLPASHAALLANLRLTELMYQPNNGGDYEFVELQNIGASPLDLSGVRFTNGLDYVFPMGTTLAGQRLHRRGEEPPGLPVAISVGGAHARSRRVQRRARQQRREHRPDPAGAMVCAHRALPVRIDLAASRLRRRSLAGGPLALRTFATQLAWRASGAVHGSPGAAESSNVSIAAAHADAITTTAGGPTTLAVRVAAPGAVSYQWQQLGNDTWINLPGVATASYPIVSTQSFHAGSYRVLVSTGGETLASDTMRVTVVGATTPGTTRFVNLFTRGDRRAGRSQPRLETLQCDHGQL